MNQLKKGNDNNNNNNNNKESIMRRFECMAWCFSAIVDNFLK